jgi:hypothetical protein
LSDIPAAHILIAKPRSAAASTTLSRGG